MEADPKLKEKFYHPVRWSGETLSIIAAWYTGMQKNWKPIAQANPNINPNRIYTGNKILIPESLLRTRKLMPNEFVGRFYSKTPKGKLQPKPQLTQTQEEEPKLTGPKKSAKN